MEDEPVELRSRVSEIAERLSTSAWKGTDEAGEVITVETGKMIKRLGGELTLDAELKLGAAVGEGEAECVCSGFLNGVDADSASGDPLQGAERGRGEWIDNREGANEQPA
jgi:hypothetical protein